MPSEAPEILWTGYPEAQLRRQAITAIQPFLLRTLATDSPHDLSRVVKIRNLTAETEELFCLSRFWSQKTGFFQNGNKLLLFVFQLCSSLCSQNTPIDFLTYSRDGIFREGMTPCRKVQTFKPDM